MLDGVAPLGEVDSIINHEKKNCYFTEFILKINKRLF
jgi:hypothetical protein